MYDLQLSLIRDCRVTTASSIPAAHRSISKDSTTWARVWSAIKKYFPFLTRALHRWGRYRYPSRLDHARKRVGIEKRPSCVHASSDFPLNKAPIRAKDRTKRSDGSLEAERGRQWDSVHLRCSNIRLCFATRYCSPSKGQIKVSYVNDGE